MGPQISRDQKIPGLGFPENPGSKRLNKSRDFGIPNQDIWGICANLNNIFGLFITHSLTKYSMQEDRQANRHVGTVIARGKRHVTRN
jgi:hypothetical protein